MTEGKRAKLEPLVHGFWSLVHDIDGKSFCRESDDWRHHGDTTVYMHCVRTAWCVYRLGLWFHVSALRSCVRAAMVHDQFGYDWQKTRAPRGLSGPRHAIWHGRAAVRNMRGKVVLNANQKDAILKHMFPLYPIPPSHVEGWLLTLADKITAIEECLMYVIGRTSLPMAVRLR